LLSKYVPETKKEKRQRLKEEASKKAEEKKTDKKDKKGKKEYPGQKPIVVKFGLNHVTTLVETKQAKLVVIAHDVVPIELMIFLPDLCKKMKIPYCFVKGKARLGKFVHQKQCTAVALTEVRKEDMNDLNNLCTYFNGVYNENVGIRKLAAEPVMSASSQHKIDRKRGMKKKRAAAAPAPAAPAEGS
jgi:large subunit ribosomal protein L7Ae